MKTGNWLLAASACAALASAGAASATTISLGASAQNYVLYGQGAYAPGLGTFTNQQGDEVYNSGITTETLSGAITGSSSSALSSGSYSLITTFSGVPIGSGGTEVVSISNASNPNYFNFSYLAPSVTMTLFLTGTPSGNVTIPLYANGTFGNFSFTFTGLTCTGPEACDQNDVGLTPGATGFSPTTIFVTIPDVAPVPEPATWALMLSGFGLMGYALRRRARMAIVYG